MRSKPGTRGGFRPPHGGAVRLRHARLGAVPHRLLLRVAMGMLAGAVALATATVVAERVRTEAAVLTLADQGLMWQATLGRARGDTACLCRPGKSGRSVGPLPRYLRRAPHGDTGPPGVGPYRARRGVGPHDNRKRRQCPLPSHRGPSSPRRRPADSKPVDGGRHGDGRPTAKRAPSCHGTRVRLRSPCPDRRAADRVVPRHRSQSGGE
jgi:hypothetical protein